MSDGLFCYVLEMSPKSLLFSSCPNSKKKNTAGTIQTENSFFRTVDAKHTCFFLNRGFKTDKKYKTLYNCKRVTLQMQFELETTFFESSMVSSGPKDSTRRVDGFPVFSCANALGSFHLNKNCEKSLSTAKRGHDDEGIRNRFEVNAFSIVLRNLELVCVVQDFLTLSIIGVWTPAVAATPLMTTKPKGISSVR